MNRIKNLTSEARSCLQDTVESINTPHFEEEWHSAVKAVDNAELAYSELLEELASRECVSLLNEVRKTIAGEVTGVWAGLREELTRLKQEEGGKVTA